MKAKNNTVTIITLRNPSMIPISQREPSLKCNFNSNDVNKLSVQYQEETHNHDLFGLSFNVDLHHCPFI